MFNNNGEGELQLGTAKTSGVDEDIDDGNDNELDVGENIDGEIDESNDEVDEGKIVEERMEVSDDGITRLKEMFVQSLFDEVDVNVGYFKATKLSLPSRLIFKGVTISNEGVDNAELEVFDGIEQVIVEAVTVVGTDDDDDEAPNMDPMDMDTHGVGMREEGARKEQFIPDVVEILVVELKVVDWLIGVSREAVDVVVVIAVLDLSGDLAMG